MTDDNTVTPSSGCVFFDLDVPAPPNEKLKALYAKGREMTQTDHIPAMRANGIENPTASVEKRSLSSGPVEIDPMEPFAEVPRMLPSFSTRAGRLRMIYVDAAGKQRALNLNTADLTRIIHSAAIALEALTREKTMVEKIDDITNDLMGSARV